MIWFGSGSVGYLWITTTTLFFLNHRLNIFDGIRICCDSYTYFRARNRNITQTVVLKESLNELLFNRKRQILKHTITTI